MSTILKPSISRMRTIVVLTGRIAGDRDVPERLAVRGAVDERRLADLLVEAFEGREQDDEHERGPLPRVADDDRDPGRPRIGHPGVLAHPEGREDGLQRPFPVSVIIRNM